MILNRWILEIKMLTLFEPLVDIGSLVVSNHRDGPWWKNDMLGELSRVVRWKRVDGVMWYFLRTVSKVYADLHPKGATYRAWFKSSQISLVLGPVDFLSLDPPSSEVSEGC